VSQKGTVDPEAKGSWHLAQATNSQKSNSGMINGDEENTTRRSARCHASRLDVHVFTALVVTIKESDAMQNTSLDRQYRSIMQSPKRQCIRNQPDRDNPQITIDSSKVPTLASSCFACASDTSMGQVVEPNRVHLTTTRGWALSEILSHKPFIPVPRVSALDATATQAAITQHEQDGIPYIIEGFHKHEKWPKMFTPEWLSDNGPQGVSRN